MRSRGGLGYDFVAGLLSLRTRLVLGGCPVVYGPQEKAPRFGRLSLTGQ